MSFNSIPINTVSAGGCPVATELVVSDIIPKHIQRFAHIPITEHRGFSNPYREVTFSQSYSTELKDGALASLPSDSPLLIDCAAFNNITMFAVGVTGETYSLSETTFALVSFIPDATNPDLWCPIGVDMSERKQSKIYDTVINDKVLAFTWDNLVWKAGAAFSVSVHGVARCAFMVVQSGMATRLKLCYHLST